MHFHPDFAAFRAVCGGLYYQALVSPLVIINIQGKFYQPNETPLLCGELIAL